MCHLNLRKFARETREMTRKMNIYFVITPMTHSVTFCIESYISPSNIPLIRGGVEGRRDF